MNTKQYEFHHCSDKLRLKISCALIAEPQNSAKVIASLVVGIIIHRSFYLYYYYYYSTLDLPNVPFYF